MYGSGPIAGKQLRALTRKNLGEAIFDWKKFYRTVSVKREDAMADLFPFEKSVLDRAIQSRQEAALTQQEAMLHQHTVESMRRQGILPLPKLDEHAQPLQSLTESFIETQNPDGWNEALDIIYGVSDGEEEGD